MCIRDRDIGEQLVLIGLVAERDGARLILADRLQHLAERRVDGAEDHEETEQETGEDDVIEDRWVGEVEDSEKMALRNTLDAVLAMGEGHLQIYEIQELGPVSYTHLTLPT